MYFTQGDKEYLKSLGEDEAHIRQIESAVRRTVFKYRGQRITRDKAIDLLGRERFLSGMQRCTYHQTAVRTTDGEETVFFETK